jgi:hypothetical protein
MKYLDILDDLSEDFKCIIQEGLQSKMPHLLSQLTSKKSKWPDKDADESKIVKFIEKLSEYDPTKTGTYLPYIIRQIARDNLVITMDNFEDADRISSALNYFHEHHKKKDWPGHRDINQYKNWRELEDLTTKFQEEGKEFKSGKELRREQTQGMDELFEVTIPNKSKTTYTFVKFTTPEALARCGSGTKWCTTNPDTAETYLKRGPLYIVFRDDKKGNVGRSGQVLQMTHDGNDNKLYDDRSIGRISPALDYALAKWIESGNCPIPKVVKDIRSLAPDYQGRPPV